MKILHIIPTYIPAYRYGGPIQSVHSLNVGLVENGADVTVYTTDINGSDNLDVPLKTPVMIDGVKIFYFKSSFPRFWFYSRSLHRFLAEEGARFDIFHITSTFLAASTLGAYYAKKFKKPYIISPRGNFMLSPFRKKNLKKSIYSWLIEKRNLRDAAAIHFTSFMEEEEYKKGGFPLKRGIVLANIIDVRRFALEDSPIKFRKKFRISDDKKIVLYLGRLGWIKGFDTLIPAFKKVIEQKPNTILALVGGDDGYKNSILRLIEQFKLDKNVLLTGMLAGAEKNAALKESDIFVMPSYSESFGMSVIEAMLEGLPVIVTKGVGISDFINQAKAGIVVKKNEEELSKAILKILEDGGLAKKMGDNGRNFVKEEFSQDKIATQFLREYQFIVNNNKN